MAGRQKAPSKSDNSRYARARRYGRKSTTILVIVLIILVALGLCGFRFAYSTMLPDVIEMSETDATKLLEDYGMVVQVQKDWSDKYDEGMVMAQEPKGGAQVSPDDTVIIVVSKGPESVSMPELIGISREEAVNNLSKSGVSWIISEAYSDEIAAGSVISQTPEAGVEVIPGQNVLLVISKGEKPSIRTAEDVEVTKKTSSKDKDGDDRTTSTSRSTDDDDDDDDEDVTTETTTSTSTSRSTRSTSSTSNNNTSASQSSTSQSNTETSTNTDTSTSTDTVPSITDTTSEDNTGGESTGDPGLDEQLEENVE